MLTTKQLKDIEELQRICDSRDKIQLKLNWDMLRTREDNENNDFFHYENGELVGFLGLYGFGSKIEICGMVHPHYRRKGIFSRLLTVSMKLITKHDNTTILLNAPSASFTAQNFLEKYPCRYTFTEYQMKWVTTDLLSDEEVTLRKAKPDDLDSEVRLDVLCFGFSETDAKQYNERIKNDETQQFYMIDYHKKNVGKLRIAHTDGEAWIYGFAVLPQFQGMGIGRKALSKSIILENRKGYPIFLEVEAKNSHALGLYESCGFQIFHSQDYYKVEK
ncbi:GNAT family N-acetyltransferase [Virgibacillus ndiopensis]|uniref:GNAT family N-acetyltransferase n=1 Tax=Virgibacillus ndiopensis TaxID=2004408 RepID=UPI000C06CD3B|nr:GNAT family N-acetyltransferase [Virgibacillus ndiopensis]